MRKFQRLMLGMLALAILGLAAPASALAQQAEDVELVAPATGVVVGATDDRLELDIFIKNYASARRRVAFVIEGAPDGWDVATWHRFQNFKVTEAVVQPTPADGEGERFRVRMSFPAERPAGVETFTLRVLDGEGGIEYDSAEFAITTPQSEQTEAGEVKFRSDFPRLTGPATSTFQFEMVVINETGAERSFNLAAEVPLGWEVSFLPAFGEEKVISAVTVRDNLNERLKVRVRPSFAAAPGEYTIPVKISSGEFETEGQLIARVVGRGDLRVTTPTGRLSFDAQAGSATTTKLRLDNRGSAEMRDVALSADLPSADWRVTFETTTVESVKEGVPVDVDMTVTPPQDAIPGDYVVTVRGTHPDSTTTASMRVTVEQSTIWGWLGIVLVVLVIGGLVGLFIRLGRR